MILSTSDVCGAVCDSMSCVEGVMHSHIPGQCRYVCED